MTSNERRQRRAIKTMLNHIVMGACMGFLISAALFLPLVLQ